MSHYYHYFEPASGRSPDTWHYIGESTWTLKRDPAWTIKYRMSMTRNKEYFLYVSGEFVDAFNSMEEAASATADPK